MATATERPSEQVELTIEGMTCASCATRIEKRLNRLEGAYASVNYASEQAAVSFDPGRISVEDLIGTVEAAGYHASLPKETLGKEDPARPYRLRLVVAVVLSVPLSLLAMVAKRQFCDCTRDRFCETTAPPALRQRALRVVCWVGDRELTRLTPRR